MQHIYIISSNNFKNTLRTSSRCSRCIKQNQPELKKVRSFMQVFTVPHKQLVVLMLIVDLS